MCVCVCACVCLRMQTFILLLFTSFDMFAVVLNMSRIHLVFQNFLPWNKITVLFLAVVVLLLLHSAFSQRKGTNVQNQPINSPSLPAFEPRRCVLRLRGEVECACWALPGTRGITKLSVFADDEVCLSSTLLEGNDGVLTKRLGVTRRWGVCWWLSDLKLKELLADDDDDDDDGRGKNTPGFLMGGKKEGWNCEPVFESQIIQPHKSDSIQAA